MLRSVCPERSLVLVLLVTAGVNKLASLFVQGRWISRGPRISFLYVIDQAIGEANTGIKNIGLSLLLVKMGEDARRR